MVKGQRTPMGNCAINTFKSLLVMFNLIVFVAGICLIIASTFVIIDSKGFRGLLATQNMNNVFSAVWLLLAVGIALVLLGLIGCYGSMSENRCLLAFYFFMIFIIFVVEIVAGILAFVFYPQVKTVALKTQESYGIKAADFVAYNQLPQSQKDLSDDITRYWDTIQTTFSCCGYTDLNEWNNATFTNEWAAGNFPISCCSENDFASIYDQDPDMTPEQAAQLVLDATCPLTNVTAVTQGKGCETKARDNIYLIGGVALGILAVEFLSMFASCCMYRSLDDEY